MYNSLYIFKTYTTGAPEWVRLDLAATTKVQIVKQNPLLQFSELKATRTTNVDIPATPHNNVALGLSNDPRINGDRMRQVYSARYIYSGGLQACKLYISEATEKTYKAVLIFEDLGDELNDFLKAKIADVLRARTRGNGYYLEWNDESENGYFGGLGMTGAPAFGYMFYNHDGTSQSLDTPHINPSFDLYDLVRLIVTASGWTLYDNGENVLRGLRLIVTDPKTGECDDVVVNTSGDDSVNDFALYPDCVFYTEETDGTHNYYALSALTFTCLWQNAQVTIDGNTTTLSEGQSVEVERGQRFALQTGYGAFAMTAKSETLRDLRKPADQWHGYFDTLHTLSNLPDITVSELLQAVANITGTFLFFDKKNQQIYYDAIAPAKQSSASWPLISIDSITRDLWFGAGQSTLVKFEDGTSAPVSYSVNNQTLDAVSEWVEVPFYGCTTRYGIAHVPDWDRFRIDWEDLGFVLVSNLPPSGTSADPKRDLGLPMMAVSLKKNAQLKQLADISTYLQIKARASMFDVFSIKPDTAFNVGGVLYLWVEIQADGETVNLKLQKWQ